MKPNVWTAASGGFALACIIYCLRQDVLGLEGYIASVRALWISPWISMPINIVGLVILIAYFANAARWERKQ